MFPEWITTLAMIVGGVGSVVWGLAIWLSTKFSSMERFFSTKLAESQKMFIDKLEYHEKHDDQRFGSITDSLWEIRLQNAVIQGNRAFDQKSERPAESRKAGDKTPSGV